MSKTQQIPTNLDKSQQIPTKSTNQQIPTNLNEPRSLHYNAKYLEVLDSSLGWFGGTSPCSCPTGGGRNPVTNRLLRHFNFLAYPTIDDDNMHRIFSSILEAFLKTEFAAELQGLAATLVTSAIDMYNVIQQVWPGCVAQLLPVRAKGCFDATVTFASNAAHISTEIPQLVAYFPACWVCSLQLGSTQAS